MAVNDHTLGSNEGGLKTSFLTEITDTSDYDLEGVGTADCPLERAFLDTQFEHGPPLGI